MKIQNICTKKTYEKNGEKKTIWLQVGTLKTLDNGNSFIELNMFPGVPFYVFDQKKKEEALPEIVLDSNHPSDVPF